MFRQRTLRMPSNNREAIMSGIVVGVDDSETACRAIKQAALVAEALGEPLHLVMAAKPGVSRTITNGAEDFVIDWVTEAAQLLESITTKAGVSEATTSVGDKDPAKAICAEAERRDASLIVVGNRRMQGASRVLGAVASDVLKHAPCDVLVAHTNAEPAELVLGIGEAEPQLAASPDIDLTRIKYRGRPLWV